jgi:hypothetical protein
MAYTCPILLEQMKAYRYAENIDAQGQKRDKEQVFKKDDELPDALRYAVMAWPELPMAPIADKTPQEQARLDAFDERTRADLARMKEYNQRDTQRDLDETDEGFPWGDFWGHGVHA